MRAQDAFAAQVVVKGVTKARPEFVSRDEKRPGAHW
jgi:hypothetical protein